MNLSVGLGLSRRAPGWSTKRLFPRISTRFLSSSTSSSITMESSVSVTGLLAVATKIYCALLPLHSFSDFSTAAHDFKHALLPLQPYVDGSRPTTSPVDVTHLVWILGGCVATFSRLEKRVDRILAREIAEDELKRVVAEADLSRIMEILRLHTTSLILLLRVWTRYGGQ